VLASLIDVKDGREMRKRLTPIITSDTGCRALACLLALAVRLALSMTRPDKILIS